MGNRDVDQGHDVKVEEKHARAKESATVGEREDMTMTEFWQY